MSSFRETICDNRKNRFREGCAQQSLQLELSKPDVAREIRDDVTSLVSAVCSDLAIGKARLLVMIIVTGRPA